MLNVVHYPVFFGKSNLITNQSPKLTIKNVRTMFQNDELPESSLTKVVWERSNLDDTKAPEYDLKLNQESYKIFAEIIGEYEGELNLNADSNIPGMKNKTFTNL